MATKYYKTNRSEVLAAVAGIIEQKNLMTSTCDELAKQFNAKAKYRTDHSGASFGGLELKRPRDDYGLWTNPNSNGISRPKSTTPNKDLRPALKVLKEKYEASFSDLPSVSFEELYKSIGRSWGDFIFSGITWWDYNGYVYFQTGSDLSQSAMEILGSEYELAVQAMNEPKK